MLGDKKNMQFSTEDSSEFIQLGVAYGKSPNLDWALIEITLEDLTISNAIQVETKSTYPVQDFSTSRNDVKIMTCTGSKGASTGIMSGPSTFLKMERSNNFEEVRTATLEGRLGKSALSLATEIRTWTH